ncbi:MAG: YIP1 family protein [Gemmatimonadetes bacterium]|nr:YIP1 family protein [Gemmatimonadota bacterium]NNF37831.1 YIP1 family protein [Gemmatimonadota bacterium]NNK63267.1 YIP1 family protein [Gemmatimonadota bacterium]
MEARTSGSLVSRAIGAAMLDINVYEEVEADRSATTQAATVVLAVAIANVIGSWGSGGLGMVGGVLGAFLGWFLWAGVTNIVGTRLLGGTADWGELLRTLGFAQAPGVLAVLAIIPILGWFVGFGVAIWTLVAGVIAIRQALDFGTGKAVITALISMVIVIIASMAIGTVLGVGVGMGSALAG